jgi:hypothetical protein
LNLLRNADIGKLAICGWALDSQLLNILHGNQGMKRRPEQACKNEIRTIE